MCRYHGGVLSKYVHIGYITQALYCLLPTIYIAEVGLASTNDYQHPPHNVALMMGRDNFCGASCQKKVFFSS